MKKALLVGNGFTLNLINEYSNKPMMEAFCRKLPNLVDKIEKEFSAFTNLLGEDDIYFTKNTKEYVIDKLKLLGFRDPKKVYSEYFEKYGLIYSMNTEKIVGIETYLKVVSMFEEINIFTKEQYNEIKLVANEVYYNDGKHGRDSISNTEIDIDKVAKLLTEFKDVYTTNYDTILDDFLELEEQDRYPYHLHGGFSINHKNKNPDGRYSPSEAKLIWGINAEEKFNDLRAGLDYSDINYAHFSYGNSRIADYFDYLQQRHYDEIHILGFSGENDDHINQRIKDNQSIKNIIVYVNPEKMNDIDTLTRRRKVFGGNNKLVILKPWTEFWDKIKF